MRLLLLLLATLVAVVVSQNGNVPYGQPIKGHFTYYEDGGTGACGRKINAKKEKLVAISGHYFAEKNRSKDVFCKNVCVLVKYKGKELQVPVEDECPTKYCKKDHFDLSIAAYKHLEPNLDIGDVYGATFTFVKC